MRIEKWKMALIAAGIGVGSLMATAGTASAQYWHHHHHHHRHCWRNGFGAITCTRVAPQSYTYRNGYYVAPGDVYYTNRFYRNGYYYGTRPDGVTIRIR